MMNCEARSNDINAWKFLEHLALSERRVLDSESRGQIAAEENYQEGLDCYSKTRRWLVELDKLIHSIIPYIQGSRSSKLI